MFKECAKIWRITSPRKVYKLVPNKDMKRCLTPSVKREMQVKTTRRYYFTLTGVAEMSGSDNNKGW